MSLKKPDIDFTPQSSIKEELYGSKYPYFDYNPTLFSKITNPILRAISGINPFAMKQISDESIGFSPLNGNMFTPTTIENYPNSIGFRRYQVAHFNAVDEAEHVENNLTGAVRSPAVGGQLNLRAPYIPRGCQRQKKAFTRCKVVNGGSEKCTKEIKNLMEICPNWCLETFKETKRWIKQVNAIQHNQYLEAMEVAPYNKGRSISDISDKTYIHGSRKFLRPDSMWADDRYASVTQEEIDEAKIRHEERTKAHGHHSSHGDHGHHDHNIDYAFKPTSKPLYP